MTYCEPGSAYIALIARFLRPKRRINIELPMELGLQFDEVNFDEIRILKNSNHDLYIICR